MYYSNYARLCVLPPTFYFLPLFLVVLLWPSFFLQRHKIGNCRCHFEVGLICTYFIFWKIGSYFMIAYIFGHILVKPTIFQVSTILMYSTSCHCKFVLPMIFSFSTYVNNSMEWLGMTFQVIVKFRGSPAAKPHNLGGTSFWSI